MFKIIREILCLLNGGHFVRRAPRIVEYTEGPRWATRLSCRCGAVDYDVEGLVQRPDTVLEARR